MKNIKVNSEALYAGFGALGIGIAIFFGSKLSKVAKKLDLTIDRLENETDVEISDDTVKAAVERAAKKKAEKSVSEAADIIIRDTKMDMKRKVDDSIAEIFNDMKESVTEEMKRQVSNMSPEDLKKEVRKEAKKAMLDKLEDSMDDILDDYKENIKTMSRIYGNLANK